MLDASLPTEWLKVYHAVVGRRYMVRSRVDASRFRFREQSGDALNANTWSRKRAGLDKSPQQYNAYGFTLGGPIYVPGAFNESKQSLFFFWGQEWQRDRTVEEQTGIVPTQAMRNGDFSALLPAVSSATRSRACPSLETSSSRIASAPGPRAHERVPLAGSRVSAGRQQLDLTQYKQEVDRWKTT